MSAPEILARFADRAADEVAHADLSVSRAVAELRRNLDQIDQAIREGLRVPGSVSGSSFAESSARELVKALNDRDAAYQQAALVQNIANQVQA